MIAFTLNGRESTFDGDPETPLLWVIRDAQKLTGTKYGCGVAQCGACTVHMDGMTRRSCITPISTAEGSDTVTILSKHIEFGQGPFTGLATIVAEELDADWSQMRAVHSPADDKIYANLAFGLQGTGGSTAIANSYEQMRKAGATAIPGDPNWHLAPLEMAWEGKSLAEICVQIKDQNRNGGKTLAEIVEHMGKDHLVGWGWNPGKGREPVPGTQAEFGALCEAWAATGAHCPAGRGGGIGVAASRSALHLPVSPPPRCRTAAVLVYDLSVRSMRKRVFVAASGAAVLGNAAVSAGFARTEAVQAHLVANYMIKDETGFLAYMEAPGPLVRRFNIKVLVFDGNANAFEGGAWKVLAVIELRASPRLAASSIRRNTPPFAPYVRL